MSNRLCCALYIMNKNTVNDSSDILRNDFGKNTNEIRPKKTENRKFPFPTQVGYAVQKEPTQHLWKSPQERNGKSYQQDLFFSSLLQKSSDCDRPYLDNSSVLSVSERQSGPWRNWSGRTRGREGIVRLLSAWRNLFSHCFFPLLNNMSEVGKFFISRQRTRHCNNIEQGFVLTARTFINPIPCATAYRFHIGLQAHSTRLVSFSHLIRRLKATAGLVFAQTH